MIVRVGHYFTMDIFLIMYILTYHSVEILTALYCDDVEHLSAIRFNYNDPIL